MKNILVTGGAGFIGSNFIRLLLKNHRDIKIINLDALTYAGNLANLEDVENDDNYRFVKGDITDNRLVDKIFIDEDIDTLVNFAAESHVDRSIDEPQVFLKTNVLGTQVLLDVAKKHWQISADEAGRPKYRKNVRFLQVSTDEVYGAIDVGKFSESSPLMPNSPYAASKASADLMVRAYSKTYQLPVNITRCSNNYGGHQYPEKLIPLMILNCLNDKQLPVYGDGNQVRDWIHVKDHCQGICAVLKSGRIGEIYNIGANDEIKNIDLVKLIVEKLNKPMDLITYVQDRLGHDRRYAIDCTKIKMELNWQSEYTFAEGIQETIDWYVKNSQAFD